MIYLRKGVLILILALCSGCAAGLGGKGAEPLGNVATGGEASAERSLGLDQDSTEAVERLLLMSKEDPVASARLLESLGPDRGDSGGRRGSSGRKSSKGSSLSIEATSGYRSELAGRLRAKHGVSAGVKARGSLEAVFASWEGRAWIRRILLGCLRVSMGEGLVLGGPSLFLRPGRARAGKPLLRIAPSLARWGKVRGLSLGAGAGAVSLETVLWQEGHTSARSSSVLFALAGRLGPSRLGTALLGSALDGGGEGRGGGKKRSAALSVFFRLQRDGGLAGELALVRGKVLFAATISNEEAARWRLRVFRSYAPAPYASWSENLRGSNGMIQGGALYLAKSYGRLRVHFTLHAARRWKASYARKYRLGILSLSNRMRKHVAWSLSASLSMDEKSMYSSVEAVPVSEKLTREEARMRASLVVDPSGAVSHELLVDLVFDRPGKPAKGALLAAGTRFRLGHLEAEFKVSRYSIGAGRRFLISRPGAGTSELLAWVYADGTDVSARIRLQVGEGAELFGYYGLPWLKPSRVYIGGRWRFGSSRSR